MLTPFVSMAILTSTASAILPALNYTALQNFIQDHKIKSIEELLPQLPAPYRSRYVLLFDSRSLHGSSFENPRAVIFGEDAKFIVSFNGEKSQSGYYAFETMEFTDNNFHYREILFPENPTNEVKFSEPGKCLKCHTDPARPIWDSFPSWPGAYGERYLMPLSPTEKEGLTKFAKIQSSHPRYKTLEKFADFSSPESFSPSARTRYSGVEQENPNSVFGNLLTKLALSKIAYEVAKAPNFAHFQFSLLASLEESCGKWEDYVPEIWRKEFSQPYESFLAETQRANLAQEDLKQIRHLHTTYTDKQKTPAHPNQNSLSPFRYLVEQALGISTRNWTLSLEKNTFDFSFNGIPEKSLQSSLLDLTADPKLKELKALQSVSSAEKYCAYLRKQSFVELSKFTEHLLPKFLTKSSAASVPQLLKVCINCHNAGVVGPEIPFQDPKKLAPALHAGNYPRGNLLDEILFRLSSHSGSRKMPRGMNISEVEREELEKYFRGLALSQ